MAKSLSEPYFLAPLDNIPGYSGARYVHQVIYFPLPESAPTSIVQHVKAALAKTIEAIPLLAGTVRHVSNPSQKGKMAVTAPWRNADEIITVKDLTRTTYTSYKTLRSNHFPSSEVDYSVLMSLPPSGQDDGPVMMVQINFIKGGMIWGIVFDHAYTDGTGAAFIPKVWAAYCRGEDGSKIVTPDVMQRERLMYGSKTGNLDNFPLFYYDPAAEASPAEASAAEASDTEVREKARSSVFRFFKGLRSRLLFWFRSLASSILQTLNRLGAIMYQRANLSALKFEADKLALEVFFFPREKLKELKRMASTQIDWISTNDALASLLYCCITDITKAKAHPNSLESINNTNNATSHAHWIKKMAVLGSPETKEPFSVLGFCMNARKHITPSLPAGYIGNVAIWDTIAAPLSTVSSTPQAVSEFAYRLRRRMQSCDSAYVNDLIGVMDSVPDISRVGLTPGPFAEFLVVVNSWAGFKWHDIDWGRVVGGKCERLRIATVKIPGFCLVLPEIGPGTRCEGGEGLEVVITLKQEYLDVLKKNELFMSFAEWRCN